MLDLLRPLFGSDFLPHGQCYLWTPGLLWLHGLADSLTGLSYVAISFTLVYLVHCGRHDIPFHRMFLAFGIFIVACGGTHFMELWTIWRPYYWLSGIVKAVTAVASVATAIALPPLVPLALGLVRSARLSDQRREELELAHDELHRVHGQLKEIDQLKTQFFANISHELRTPLALIIGPTERLLGSSELTGAQRRDLEVVDRNARTLLKHVNDLLDLSRLDAGKMPVEYAEMDLAGLVRLAAAHFDALAGERGIRCTIEAPKPVPAQVDGEKVRRVVLNLLSNAFKFSPDGGEIRCVVEQAAPPVAGGGRGPQWARIVVRDSGPGVPVEMRGAIFERFRQGDVGTTRRFGGTGLGLAIVKAFVDLHRGRVSVGPAPEGGAAFSVELPIEAPAGAAVGRAPTHSAEDGQQLARQALEELRTRGEVGQDQHEGERALVLVVDDNPEMSRFVGEILAQDYRVERAVDGREGLERAAELKPDLILSDVMMPEMSGEELLAGVRARGELEAVPFVLLTAKADDELRVRLLREGAQDCLVKPFSPEELRARVSNLVTMKRAREVLQREVASHGEDLVALAREVTVRKRELETAGEAMQLAREAAERASQVKTTFLRLVSHELRAPINSLQLQLELLRRGEDRPTERQRAAIDRISRSSGRLNELIESLLEYTRIESGRLVVHPEELDMVALGREVVEELRPHADARRLSLSLRVDGDLPTLRSDPRLVRLVIVNLTSNAIRYTEQGEIEVTLSHATGQHRIAVRDTGPGIPADRQALIFEPFEQLEPVRNKHSPGVGLGLTIVRDIAQALGGSIEVRSEMGEGSTFTLFLPSSGTPA